MDEYNCKSSATEKIDEIILSIYMILYFYNANILNKLFILLFKQNYKIRFFYLYFVLIKTNLLKL